MWSGRNPQIIHQLFSILDAIRIVDSVPDSLFIESQKASLSILMLRTNCWLFLHDFAFVQNSMIDPEPSIDPKRNNRTYKLLFSLQCRS